MFTRGTLPTLSYTFQQPALLRQALTHRSFSGLHNERLEFLGDAVLGLIIAEILSERFPMASEGDLSRLRSILVQQATLAKLAREMKLGEALFLGSGECKTDGADRDSILSDAFEAVLAAVYLDGGLEEVRNIIHLCFTPLLNTVQPGNKLKDGKTQLQELMQAQQLELPDYEVIGVLGKEHEQVFHVRCRIQLNQLEAEGQGNSRKEAEQVAATRVLSLIQEQNN
jgi:ribonuclease-3